jgi:murein L,D-transpeptidase YafK
MRGFIKNIFTLLLGFSFLAGFAEASELPNDDLDPSQGVLFRAFKHVDGPVEETRNPKLAKINVGRGALEAWVWSRSERRYKLYKSFKIVNFTGLMGPKVKMGDHQAPEGFYNVNLLKTDSQYGKYALKYDFPNKHDRSRKWNGGLLEIHGGKASDGCFAMGQDNQEIYELARKAMKGGNKQVQVQIFPFPMTEENLNQVRDNRWYPFWQNLKKGYDAFEETRLPPHVETSGGEYSFQSVGTPAPRLQNVAKAPRAVRTSRLVSPSPAISSLCQSPQYTSNIDKAADLWEKIRDKLNAADWAVE